MKLLFAIEHLISGGASYAAIDLAIGLLSKKEITKAVFFTEKISIDDHAILSEKIKVYKGDALEMLELCEKENFDLIHWFRTNSSKFFSEFIQSSPFPKKLPPISITHCQLPTSHNLMLSPLEIKWASKIIFITNTALNHFFHRGIPKSQKTMIYFGTDASKAEVQTKAQNHVVHIGRGSTLNKCHPRLIETFNKLRDKNTQFSIVGKGKKKWIEEEILRHDLSSRVKIYGQMDRSDWKHFVSSLDIFLYQLPLKSYSAIDNTMQDAMLAEVPIVYYGPKAPKELIIHNKTGLIARNIKQLIHYTDKLVEDPNLRLQLGKAAKERILNDFNINTTFNNYHLLFSNLVKQRYDNRPNNLSLLFRVVFFLLRYKEPIAQFFRKIKIK